MNTRYLLLLPLAVFLLHGCTDTETSSGPPPEEVTTATLLIDGVAHEMVMDAEWDVLDDEVCGAPQVGGYHVLFTAEQDGEPMNLGVDVNFDGLNPPPMPVEAHNFTFKCPNLERPQPSGVALSYGYNESRREYESSSGMVTMEVERTGVRTIMSHGSLNDIVFVTGEGQTITVSGTFEGPGEFSDGTEDKRFSQWP